MAVTVETRLERVLEADVEAVYDFVADGENDPKWCASVRSSRLVEGQAGRAGAVYRIEQELERGRYETMELRVEAAERPRRIEWGMDNIHMEYASTMRFEAAAGGTRVVQENRAVLKKVPRIAAPMVRRIVRKALERQMDALSRAVAPAA